MSWPACLGRATSAKRYFKSVDEVRTGIDRWSCKCGCRKSVERKKWVSHWEENFIRNLGALIPEWITNFVGNDVTIWRPPCHPINFRITSLKILQSARFTLDVLAQLAGSFFVAWEVWIASRKKGRICANDLSEILCADDRKFADDFNVQKSDCMSSKFLFYL